MQVTYQMANGLHLVSSRYYPADLEASAEIGLSDALGAKWSFGYSSWLEDTEGDQHKLVASEGVKVVYKSKHFFVDA